MRRKRKLSKVILLSGLAVLFLIVLMLVISSARFKDKWSSEFEGLSLETRIDLLKLKSHLYRRQIDGRQGSAAESIDGALLAVGRRLSSRILSESSRDPGEPMEMALARTAFCYSKERDIFKSLSHRFSTIPNGLFAIERAFLDVSPSQASESTRKALVNYILLRLLEYDPDQRLSIAGYLDTLRLVEGPGNAELEMLYWHAGLNDFKITHSKRWLPSGVLIIPIILDGDVDEGLQMLRSMEADWSIVADYPWNVYDSSELWNREHWRENIIFGFLLNLMQIGKEREMKWVHGIERMRAEHPNEPLWTDLPEAIRKTHVFHEEQTLKSVSTDRNPSLGIEPAGEVGPSKN